MADPGKQLAGCGSSMIACGCIICLLPLLGIMVLFLVAVLTA